MEVKLTDDHFCKNYITFFIFFKSFWIFRKKIDFCLYMV